MNSIISNLNDIIKKFIKLIIKLTLPKPIQNKLKDKLTRKAKLNKVKFGNLRRLTPISRQFGYDRGLPIDRFYIENFLAGHSQDVHGRVLEVGDATYTLRFGGERVKNSDVLNVIEGNPEATIIGDLTKANHIPSEVFDCIILTQTLQLIYDLRGALATLHRILKPNGVLLATVPGISQVVKCDWGDNWYWAFTNQSVQLLFEEFFDKTNVRVENHGNVLASIAFLHGIAVEELRKEELIYHDGEYQVIITVRAVK